ncbi:10500_t:CDS:1 [Paraglomus brasilianum]|uniref:10500_t:CDS:1 n=1 Tax=Paraglomus brasilianum TaxID=144538 RepID=A0A9N9BRL7_9GLOM|nr:10500_t:CDS:1 [Paraglomus brasilianum]
MSAYFLPTEQGITLFLVYLSANGFPVVTATSITSTPCEIDLLLNPPYRLTHSLDALLDPNLRQRNKRDTTPPRPKNAFIIFRKDFEGLFRALYPDECYSIQTISKIAGEIWTSLPDVVKQYFDVLAKLARQRHRDAYPDYAYKPKQRRRDRRDNWLFKEVNKDKIMK